MSNKSEERTVEIVLAELLEAVEQLFALFPHEVGQPSGATPKGSA